MKIVNMEVLTQELGHERGQARLRSYLKNLPTGPVDQASYREVQRLLAECWSELRITTDDESLEPYKLLNRTETMIWNPPVLEFDIERHGPTVMGSTYANLHHWIVNTETCLASLTGERRRQIVPKDKALNVEPLAEEIADLIFQGSDDERLIWKDNKTKVRVAVGQIIPETNQQTTFGRLRRFRQCLELLLEPNGWRMTAANKFEKIV